MSPGRRGRGRALVLPFLLVSACSYYAQSDGERLRDEVYALKQQITVLEERVAQQKSKADTAQAALSSIQDKLSSETQAGRRNYADVGVLLDELRDQVAHLKGDVGSLQERTSSVEEKAEKTKEEVELRFGEQQKLKEEAASRQNALLNAPEASLKEAERLLEAKDAKAARSLLRSLELRQRSAKGWSVYAPKAQYLIGESYFVEENWRQAVAAFNTVRKDHPKAKGWVAASLLRLGQCLDRLGHKEDAKIFYERVSKQYPRHPAAKEAKRLLALRKG